MSLDPLLGPDGGTFPLGSMFRINGLYFPPRKSLIPATCRSHRDALPAGCSFTPSLGSTRFNVDPVDLKLKSLFNGLADEYDDADNRSRNTNSSTAPRLYFACGLAIITLITPEKSDLIPTQTVRWFAAID